MEMRRSGLASKLSSSPDVIDTKLDIEHQRLPDSGNLQTYM